MKLKREAGIWVRLRQDEPRPEGSLAWLGYLAVGAGVLFTVRVLWALPW